MHKESDRTLKRSRGAYVFAKRGQNELAEGVHQRKDDDEYGENDVFQLSKYLCKAVFLDLGRFEFVDEILNESEGAEVSADPASEKERVEQDDAHHIIGDRLVSRRQRILKRAEWAGCRCSGAGITAETGRADTLELALINSAVAEALEICIEEKSGVKLNESALRQLVRGEPFFNFHNSASLTKTDALGADSDSLLQNVVIAVLSKTDDDENTSDSGKHEANDITTASAVGNRNFL